MSKTEIAKQTAAKAGMVIYALAPDGTMWVSGLERWLTPEAVIEEAGRRLRIFDQFPGLTSQQTFAIWRAADKRAASKP